MSDWSILDVQMRQYSPRLRDDLRIEVDASNYPATTVANECAALPIEALTEIRAQDVVGLYARLEELTAFQSFMDLAHSIPSHPSVVGAQVITQNYVCFVYLGESCFKILQRHMRSTSATRRCCGFLTDNPIRAFRNALAHANWRYKDDFSGLHFWARKGSDPNEPLSEFEVGQLEAWFLAGSCSLYQLCCFHPCNQRGLTRWWSLGLSSLG
jgi:hypothetical protein